MLYLPNANSDVAGPGADVLHLAALKEIDPTHILFRRFTGLASLSLDLEGNHLEQLGHDLRQMVLTGDEGVNDFNERFMSKLGRYRMTPVLICFVPGTRANKDKISLGVTCGRCSGSTNQASSC